MRLALVPLAALAIAACDNASPTGGPSGPIRTDAPAGNSADDTQSAAQSGDLPPEGPGPRFVGRWALDEKSCESAAWQLTDSTLRTPDGPSCSFNRITEVENGYDIQATCSADGPPTSDTIKLRFVDDTDALGLESESLSDASLHFCGRDT